MMHWSIEESWVDRAGDAMVLRHAGVGVMTRSPLWLLTFCGPALGACSEGDGPLAVGRDGESRTFILPSIQASTWRSFST